MSWDRIIIFILLLCCVTWPGGAESALAAHTTLNLKAKPPLEAPVRGRLTATPMVATHSLESPPPKQLEVEIPGQVRLDLPPGWTWKFELDVVGFWSPPKILRAGAEQEATIELLSVGKITGRVVCERGEEPLRQIELRFSDRSFRQRAVGGLHGSVTCPVSENRIWTCTLPLGAWDLRLRTAGFIPHYFWDQVVESEKTLELGEATWRRGSSLSGWVVRDDDQPVSVESKVSLMPQTGGGPGRDEKLEATALNSPISPRGFFQLTGLAPGTYRLEAEEKGLAKATLDQITILPDQEATLLHPVVLQRPISPVFKVNPARSIGGDAWQIDLLSQFSTRESVASGTTDEQGFWQPREIAPGEYLLVISDVNGDRKVFEELNLGPETEFEFKIPVVWVEGRVQLGDEGIPASLYFGGRHGALSVRMDADDEGQFTGALPREGEWKLQVLARNPSIFRTLHDVEVETDGSEVARVDVYLPDTTVEVEVVDEAGTPVSGARVLLMRRTVPSEAPSWGDTDSEGLFEIRGLGFADYVVEAHREGPEGPSASESTGFQLSATSPEATARLVMRRKRNLVGRVLSPLGVGVPGARIEVRGARDGGSVPTLLIPQTWTETDGSFQISLPWTLQRARVVVMASGYVLRIFEVSLEEASELEVVVDQLGGGDLILNHEQYAEAAFWESPRVTYEGYLPINLATLLNWSRMNGQHADSQGQLRIPHMPVGRYEICPGNSARSCATHNLTAGEIEELALPVEGEGSSER